MKRHISSDVWVLAVLLLFIVALALAANKQQKDDTSGEMLPVRTSYSARPGGMRALYRTLDRMGYRVVRHITELTVPPDDGVLFLISPTKPVKNAEWQALRGWVAKGNLLVLAMGYETRFAEPDKKLPTVRSTPTVPSFLSANAPTFRAPRARHEAAPTQALMKKLILKSARDGKDGSLWNQPYARLYGHGKLDTVSYRTWGKGEIILLSSGWSVSNEGIGSAGNLTVVLNAIDHRDPSHKLRVTFEEYHHGYGRSPGLMSLIGRGARLGIAQFFLAFVLLVFAVSRRFGRPIPLRERGRQRNEYLGSMASLLKRAGATSIAKKEIEGKYVGDIAHSVGLPRASAPGDVLAAAERRRPDKAEALRSLFRMSDAAEEEQDVLTLAGRWHEMRKELMKTK